MLLFPDVVRRAPSAEANTMVTVCPPNRGMVLRISYGRKGHYPLDRAVLKACAFRWWTKMSAVSYQMSMEPKKTTLAVRRYYRQHSDKVRCHKLLRDIALNGRCVNEWTLDNLGVTKAEIIGAWLSFRKEHVPTGTKQLKMQRLVAGWM